MVKWIIILVLLFTAGVCLAAFKMYRMAFNRSGNREEAFETDHNLIAAPAAELLNPVKEKKVEWQETSIEKSVQLQSVDGLRLQGYVYPQKESKRWVLLVHGFGGNHKEMFDKAPYFAELGYNLLLPDNRAHGESEGQLIGFGWQDRLDILVWINYLIEQESECEIILYGISMGAAAVMMTLGEELPRQVKAAIEDCGYSSVGEELSYQLKQIFHLPSEPLLSIVSLINKLRQGWWLKEGSSVRQLSKNTRPTLFIHGTADTFVPFEMLEKNVQAQKGLKDTLVIDKAQHGMAGIVGGETYWQTIREFLIEYTSLS
ncbi:alpha/beta hydrolase [Enterococcus sp. LJL128]|uniref:alpha/beta hydrolase n=1 Tax=Enterococcus sp. LJL51 TaxID=3416656 RepID=UPI003CF7CC5E